MFAGLTGLDLFNDYSNDMFQRIPNIRTPILEKTAEASSEVLCVTTTLNFLLSTLSASVYFNQ
jgi:hypothetical protein